MAVNGGYVYMYMKYLISVVYSKFHIFVGVFRVLWHYAHKVLFISLIICYFSIVVTFLINRCKSRLPLNFI